MLIRRKFGFNEVLDFVKAVNNILVSVKVWVGTVDGWKSSFGWSFFYRIDALVWWPNTAILGMTILKDLRRSEAPFRIGISMTYSDEVEADFAIGSMRLSSCFLQLDPQNAKDWIADYWTNGPVWKANSIDDSTMGTLLIIPSNLQVWRNSNCRSRLKKLLYAKK